MPTARRAARRSAARFAAVLIAGLFFTASGACHKAPDDVANGDDPLAALTVTAESRRYDEQYWRVHEQSSDSAQHQLYSQAVAYCSRKDVAIDGAKPNCRPVRTVAALQLHGDPAVGGQAY